MVKKQVKAPKSLESSGSQLPSIKKVISGKVLNHEIMNELEKIIDHKQKTGRKKKHFKKAYKTPYELSKFKIAWSFGDEKKLSQHEKRRRKCSKEWINTFHRK